MACPKCGEKVVYRHKDKPEYTCPNCGHKWTTKTQTVTVKRNELKNQMPTVWQNPYGA